MLTVALAGFGTVKLQLALPLVSAAVWPSTATVWPTKASALVDWAAFSIEIRVASWSFCLSCCSTCANCTSCWVNWLVSSGSSGFWFLSCVVSSVRKVWKLPASVVLSTPVALLDDDAAVLLLIAAVTLDETAGRMLSAMAQVLRCEYRCRRRAARRGRSRPARSRPARAHCPAPLRAPPPAPRARRRGRQRPGRA